MEETKSKKALKKAYRRKKRRTITPWKITTFLSAIISIVLVAAFLVLSIFDNTVAAFVGGSFWELENEDPTANYYTSDFDSVEEMTEYGLALCQQVEAEGAVLLVNKDNALPLAKGAAVSTFSTSAVNLVYGGTGSGNVDASKADNLKTALEKAGFAVNETLWNFYTEGPGMEYLRQGGSGVLPPAAVISEAPWSVYTDEVKSSVATYGDAAIVVFSRIGGEGSDMEFQEYNYLALDQDEQDLLAGLSEMKAAGSIKKIIVLVNSSNAMQMDFLQDSRFDVDACLWIGGVGISGINAVAEILCGDVNPSGGLVDTYCYNNFSSPAMYNFVPTTYDGYTGTEMPSNASTYMIYQEGIYVGYKYYETRYEDTVMGTGNTAGYVYGTDVAFPFGYGLSYTTFAYSDMSVSYNAGSDQFEVSVTVTNTGDVAGKEIVQIYAQSPYTQYDIDNGVEKAAVALCGFAKTAELAPGQSELVKVSVDKRELASFDTYGAGTYILDAGDYYLTAAGNAHEAVNNILAAKGYTAADGMDAAGDAALAYLWNNPTFDATTYATSLNGTEITNQLSDADINLYEGIAEGESITYLSRSDWNGTFPTEIVKLTLTEMLIADLQDVQYDPADYPAAEMPTLGADNGMQLYDMIGKDYDDPDWDTLLDQLTFDEMVSLIGDSFHWRMPATSVNAPGTRDENGPQGLTASLIASDATQMDATAFTSEDVMAATFNVDIMTQIGNVIGNNCLMADVACLYGPGNNIHRTPYGGRNFEYYSEDGFLSGMMSAYEVAAIQAKGVDVVMKHFALNDSEQDRIGLGVWVNEQAAREIYLKAFQAPFERGNANGVMTAYTRWGTTWSGGHYGLMTNIMRGEWGSQGMSITDNVLTTYVNGVDGILAGVTTFDAMMPFITNQLPEYKNDPVIVSAMREACHHNLYALANSSGMNGMGENTVVKNTGLKVVFTVRTALIVFLIIFVVSVVLWILGGRKFRRSEAYIEYKQFKKQRKAAKQ